MSRSETRQALREIYSLGSHRVPRFILSLWELSQEVAASLSMAFKVDKVVSFAQGLSETRTFGTMVRARENKRERER